VTTGIAIVTENATATVTATGIVIERPEAATRGTIEEKTEEMTDVMTEETIGAMIDVETIGGVHVRVTDETVNLRPLKIPQKRQSRLLQSKMKSSRQRGQN
jgi:hypothetical protein